MPYDRFLIAPINTGFQNNLKPWQTPDDSFFLLSNCHLRYGRVEKRFGSVYTGISSGPFQLSSRLAIPLGVINGSGNLSGTVPGTKFKVGQMFSVGTKLYTVYLPGANQPMLQSQGSITATYSTTNDMGNIGFYNFAGATPGDAVYFYPAEPVMGLTVYKNGPIVSQPAFAFDTQYAYLFTGAGWVQSITGSIPTWTGTNLDYFWATTYQADLEQSAGMYVTNFTYQVIEISMVDVNVGIYVYYNSAWATFVPYFNPGNMGPTTGPYVVTARIIVSFHNRLVLLNTIENDGTNINNNYSFAQRARWSAQQKSPLAANAWYVAGAGDNAGGVSQGGGTLDATTKEQIIGAEFIKDRLIVYFEESTWELAYTGNDVAPFQWYRINTELGAVSTFSIIPFDKEVLGIGKTGVHACSGNNVERIDNRIPQYITKMATNNGIYKRIAGIREYETESVYWTFPTQSLPSTSAYCDQILTYNYQNRSWATYSDTITCWGYFEQQPQMTWATWNTQWQDSSFTWASMTNALTSKQVIFGNQQGFVCLLQPYESTNAANMQITNLEVVFPRVWEITCIDNNMLDSGDENDYVRLSNLFGITVNSLSNAQFPILSYDRNTLLVDTSVMLLDGSIVDALSGTYRGGGTMARVSRIDIVTKEFNPYITKGRNVAIQRVDFAVDRTENGAIGVEYYVSSNQEDMANDAQSTGTALGSNVLETSPYPDVPFETAANTLWHTIYIDADGEFVQLELKLTNEQMGGNAALENFTLQGFVLYTMPTASYLR